jgi:hypothetical protein
MTIDIRRVRHRSAIAHAALAAALLVLSASACAQSLNCGGRYFGVGDSQLSVVQHCGEPMFRQAACVQRPEWVWMPSNYPGAPPQQVLVQQCVPMEEWVYGRGPGNFTSIARFHNGVIESARDGARAN